MIKASRSLVRNANQQPGAVCVGSGDSVAFDSTLVASERIAFSADRLDSWQVLKEQAFAKKVDEHLRSGRNIFALATIVTAIVLVTVPHGPILVALPITTALGFPAGLLSTPLISTPLIPAPVVSAPIVSMIVPTAVMPVSVVMGKQRPWLLAGHTGQVRPRVAGGLDGRLDGWGLSCRNRG
ncbi:hypothetical protein ACXX83_07740 [Pseudomonas sp. GNP012]